MNPHVELQFGMSLELLGTDVTGEGFLGSVNDHVILEPPKLSAAHWARLRLFSDVTFDVILLGMPRFVGFGTKGTRVFWNDEFRIMLHSDVALQSKLMAELLVTIFASVFLIPVYQHVGLEIRTLGGGVAADGTDEGLIVVMNPHVDGQR